MKKTLNYSTVSFLLMALFLLTTENNAQLRGYGFKLGLHANYLNTANEFTDDGLSYLVRPFGRYELSNTFQLEGGIGIGQYQGLDYGDNTYKTSIIPLDLRLLVAPLQFDSWNPYIYLGYGAVMWNLTEEPLNPPVAAGADTDGFEGLVELGLGIEFALNPNWSLEVTAGYNVVLDDNTNGFASNTNEEFLHEYDRYMNYGIGVAYGFAGGNTDEDNDGLTDAEEEELGTNPTMADSDGDGLSDSAELKKYNTDPKVADSDGDGLSDSQEIKTYKTDPNKADTDGDKLKDGAEVNEYKTDPTKADTDGDGLNDGDEVLKHETDPNKKDTDSDGLSDGDEINTHKTNPTKADTDGDGLSDGSEVNKIKSDPLVADTDKGSVNDGEEVERGTDPLDASDDVMAKMVNVKFEPIHFAFDKSSIRSSETAKLKKVLMFLQENKDVVLDINGYADSIGPSAYNKKLSNKRAESIKNWLVKQGISADRLSTNAFGEKDPVAKNSTEQGRMKNRRAELNTKGMK